MFRVDFDPDTTDTVHRMAQNMSHGGIGEAIRLRMGNYYDGDGMDILIRGVQDVLGTAKMGITLSEAYAERKLANPFVAYIPDKLPTQPGILSGTLYRSITGKASGTGVNIFIGNVRGSTRARSFQRAADPAAYLQKVREAAERPRQQQSETAMEAYRRVRISDVNTYADILNKRAHFLEKGIASAEGAFVDGLANTLMDEIVYQLGGR